MPNGIDTKQEQWASYYLRDDGCCYSEGIGCRECPFVECVYILESTSHAYFGQFLTGWHKDKAQNWRV